MSKEEKGDVGEGEEFEGFKRELERVMKVQELEKDIFEVYRNIPIKIKIKVVREFIEQMRVLDNMYRGKEDVDKEGCNGQEE